MKKILFLVTALVISMFISFDVNASSFTVNFVGNDTFKDEMTLSLQVDNLDGFSGSCEGLCGLVGTLDYDKEKIEIIDINALEGFNLTQGKKLVLYKAIGVSNGTNILEVKIKNKSLKNGEVTKISLNNIVASDGDKDIDTDNISKTIKLENNVNTDSSEEKTESGSINSSSKNDINKKNNNTNKNEKNSVKGQSSNNYLSSIVLSDGNIDFDKDDLSYDVVVSNDVEKITVRAFTEDSKATIDGLGDKYLSIGSNRIKLIVTAEDGSKKTYTLNVYREDNEEEILVNNDLDNDSNSSNKFSVTTILLIIGSVSLVILLIIFLVRRNKRV